jgi:hypothetical protein
MTQLRAASNGAGGQSTGLLVLAAWRKQLADAIATDRDRHAAEIWNWIAPFVPYVGRDQFLAIMDYPIFIHADVGEDSEDPEAVAYYNNVHRPYADTHGITLIDVRRTKRDGSQPTLLEHIEGSNRSLPIPVRMANGAPGNRSCTADYKIIPVDKWLKQHGASAKTPACLALGISLDEATRMRTAVDSDNPHRLRDYPLIALRLSRDDCARIVAAAGLPPAPKSACWFCPFHRRKTWQEMHDKRPSLFTKSVGLERMLNARRVPEGRDAVWLTPYNMPLDQVVMTSQADMFDDNCESGYCHT